jgi:hypothetical protein
VKDSQFLEVYTRPAKTWGTKRVFDSQSPDLAPALDIAAGANSLVIPLSFTDAPAELVEFDGSSHQTNIFRPYDGTTTEHRCRYDKQDRLHCVFLAWSGSYLVRYADRDASGDWKAQDLVGTKGQHSFDLALDDSGAPMIAVATTDPSGSEQTLIFHRGPDGNALVYDPSLNVPGGGVTLLPAGPGKFVLTQGNGDWTNLTLTNDQSTATRGGHFDTSVWGDQPGPLAAPGPDGTVYVLTVEPASPTSKTDVVRERQIKDGVVKKNVKMLTADSKGTIRAPRSLTVGSDGSLHALFQDVTIGAHFGDLIYGTRAACR